MIKTFRGLLDDGGQDKIRLSTKKGKIGYRIVKFQVIANTPGISTHESVVKIFKVSQTSITGAIDFNDGNLLAAVYQSDQANPQYAGYLGPVIFEQEIFNQDIYITNFDADSASKMNYYLELEVMTLSDNAAVVSTLRDIRLNPQVGA